MIVTCLLSIGPPIHSKCKHFYAAAKKPCPFFKKQKQAVPSGLFMPGEHTGNTYPIFIKIRQKQAFHNNHTIGSKPGHGPDRNESPFYGKSENISPRFPGFYGEKIPLL